MKLTGRIGLTILAATPLGLSLWIDSDLSSNAHIAVIGVTATAVALCDALFGQIVAMTGEMPFRGWLTPVEAKQNIKAFDSYHKEVFFAWVVTKLASSFAIMLPAATLASRRGDFIQIWRKWILLGGYLALGIALSGAVYFLFSYWNARAVANQFRLSEITKSYKENHCRSVADTPEDRREQQRQCELMSQYDSPRETSENVEIINPSK